jgi:hypothetical protein
MAITNHERVRKAMELLRAGLAPFVEREVQSAVWSASCAGTATNRRTRSRSPVTTATGRSIRPNGC